MPLGSEFGNGHAVVASIDPFPYGPCSHIHHGLVADVLTIGVHALVARAVHTCTGKGHFLSFLLEPGLEDFPDGHVGSGEKKQAPTNHDDSDDDGHDDCKHCDSFARTRGLGEEVLDIVLLVLLSKNSLSTL